MSARLARPASLLWVQGLACGAVLAFAPVMGLVLAALFWPVMVALAFDRSPGRPVARASALCAAAAVVDPLRAAWSGGLGLEQGLALATDIRVVAAAWCAAAGGWGLTVLAPVLARMALDAIDAARVTSLRAERARLRAAWSLDGEAGGRDQLTENPGSEL